MSPLVGESIVLSKGASMAVDPWRALRAPLLLPWETGFFREVMNAGDGGLDDELGLPEAVQRAELAAIDAGAHNKRGREDDNASLSPTELTWDPEEAARAQDKLEEDERSSLVAEFAGWVRSSRAASELQEQMVQGADEAEGICMVSDALVERATGTLRVRVGSLRRLQQALGMNPLDCSESSIYKELCRLRKSSAPAGRGVGFLQALRFAVVVAGSSLAKPILTSKRVVGAAYGPMQGKERKQRAALTLRQLIALEKFVCSAPSAVDVAIGGHVLFCVYAQARWSDSQSLEDNPKLDIGGDGPGVIEAVARRSKGHKGLKRLRMRTPVVALAYSVSGLKWWECWIASRSTLRLTGSPALPQVKADGSLGNTAMSSSTAATWIKSTLSAMGVPELPGRELGSHSCRATLQSWLARWGMAPSARRTLAHHLKPGDRMPLVYSRDHLVGPLGGVVRMVEAIRTKEWDPDNVRSLLLKAAIGKKDHGGAAGAGCSNLVVASENSAVVVDESYEGEVIENKIVEVVSDDSDQTPVADVHKVEGSGSEDSSSTACSDEIEYELVDDLGFDEDDEGGPYMNPRSGFVHEVGPGERNTRCGLVPIGYRKLADLSEGGKDGTGFCKKCYKL